MQVTIEVTGDQLAPTLKEIVDSMTVEDKRALAAKLAFEYFKGKMCQPDKSNYYHNQEHLRQFTQELVNQLRGHIAEQVAATPTFHAEVGRVLTAVGSEMRPLVERAVMSVVARQVGEWFSASSSFDRFDYDELARKLVELRP